MKNFYVLLFFIFTNLMAVAQNINIPDQILKTMLLNANTFNPIAFNQMGQPIQININNDNQIDIFEANLVYGLIISGNAIQTLEGVQFFTNLQFLTCSYLQINSESFSSFQLNNLTQLNCSGNQIDNLNTIAAAFPNLTILNCGNNPITELEPLISLSQLSQLKCDNTNINSLSSISSLNNLNTLSCNSCNLTTLDPINNMGLLTILSFANNQITEADLSHWTALRVLDCSNNLLNELAVNLTPDLANLQCNNNNIATLNVASLTDLTDINCQNNQLTDLDLSNSVSMTRVNCADNQITSIDLSNSNDLHFVNCSNNLLNTLSIKNGKSELIENIIFSGNPALSYICADDTQIDDIESLITLYGYSNCHVNSYCSFTPGGLFYSIQGSAKFDANGDGCDPGDTNLSNIKLLFNDGTNTAIVIADNSGSYHNDVQQGTQSITPILEHANYFTISPANIEVVFPAQASPFLQNFCITANGTHNDLEIIMISLDAASPGFDANYKMIYKNKGTQIQSGTVNIAFDDLILDYQSSSPVFSSQVDNMLNYTFTNLKPFESRTILLKLNLNSPMEVPAVIAGSILNFAATINSSLTDETASDNVSTLNQTVVNSFDPNDKTCLEGATITPEMVGKYVHYMIRFENSGTASAQNIVVKDIIDLSKFDITSLIPVDGSHQFETRISAGNKVEFIFENINLPFDDANNDGYVVFKIKTLPTLTVGNSFSNTASIYFDYNFPIITEPAVTTIAVLKNKDFDFQDYFAIYPNPVNDVLQIQNKSKIEISSISIYDILGQIIMSIPNSKNMKSIDVSNLKSGAYFLNIKTDKGTSNEKFIKR